MPFPVEIQKLSQMPSQGCCPSQFLELQRKISMRRCDATSVFDMTAVLGCVGRFADSSAHIAHNCMCGTIKKSCMHSSCLRDKIHGLLENLGRKRSLAGGGDRLLGGAHEEKKRKETVES